MFTQFAPSPPPSTWVMKGRWGEGGLSRTSIQEGFRSNWDFGWELGLQVGVISFRWDSKTPYIKMVNRNLKQQNDSDCNFYNFSLLIPYPSEFLVVCICILIFHGIYSPLPTNIFFCGGLTFFSCLAVKGWEDFKFLP